MYDIVYGQIMARYEWDELKCLWSNFSHFLRLAFPWAFSARMFRMDNLQQLLSKHLDVEENTSWMRVAVNSIKCISSKPFIGETSVSDCLISSDTNYLCKFLCHRFTSDEIDCSGKIWIFHYKLIVKFVFMHYIPK